MNKKQFLTAFLIVLCLCTAAQASAASLVTVASSGGGTFVVQGTGISAAAAMDISISYDTDSLGSPQVIQGALIKGAMLAVNDRIPGVLRLGIIRITPMTGSGPIATITFSTSGGSPGRILGVLAKFTDVEGAALPVQTQILNPEPNVPDQTAAAPAGSGANGSDTSGTALTQRSTGAAVAGTTAAGAGIVVVPVPTAPGTAPQPAAPTEQAPSDGDQPQKQTASTMEPAAPASPAKTAKATPAEPARKKVMEYASVLDRFREFKGERTPKALVALFDGREKRVQEPALVLSDGKSTVTLAVELDPKGESNNFLVDNATLVSLKPGIGKNKWIIELLPDRNVWEATLAIPRDHQYRVIPIIVAPPADLKALTAGGKLTEAAFSRFLKERGTPKAPQYDLNNDGVRDALDDYIFTANYIARPQKKTSKDTKGK